MAQPAKTPTKETSPPTSSAAGQPTKPWSPQFYIPSAESIRLNAAFFSVAGVGKTTLAASASTVDAMAPVAIVNAESGMEALTEDVYDEDGRKIVDVSGGGLQVVDFASFKNLKAIMEYFRFENHGFKTLVLDTLDEMLLRSVAKWDRYYVPYTPEGLPNDRQDDNRMGMKIFNRATKEMCDIVRDFRDLPMHVLFTTHETEKALEKDGPGAFRMALTPQLYYFVEGALSVIGRLTVEKRKGARQEEEDDDDSAQTVRVIRFQSPNGRLRVKDRTPGQKMGRGIMNPTMQKMWDRRIGRDAG